jgi:uncharacterized protein
VSGSRSLKALVVALVSWELVAVLARVPASASAVGLVLIGTAAAWARAWEAVVLAALFLLMLLWHLIAPDAWSGIPSLPFLVPFLAVLPLAAALPGRNRLAWLRFGRMDHWGWVAFTSVASVGALLAWATWTDNLGVGSDLARATRGLSRAGMAGVILAFALVNAYAEEVVYRGVVQEALRRALGPGWPTLALQAAAFASVHFHEGFPNGAVGTAMVFIYGLMLGWLRERGGGIGAPWVAHVVADLVIALVLVAPYLP